MVDQINSIQRNNMAQVLYEREKFLLIGLTGRIGSGCSKAADIMNSDRKQINLPEITPGHRGMRNEERDLRTIYQYYESHWIAFDKIMVRSVISTFLLNDFDGFINDYLRTGTARIISEEKNRLKLDIISNMYYRRIFCAILYKNF